MMTEVTLTDKQFKELIKKHRCYRTRDNRYVRPDGTTVATVVMDGKGKRKHTLVRIGI